MFPIKLLVRHGLETIGGAAPAPAWAGHSHSNEAQIAVTTSIRTRESQLHNPHPPTTHPGHRGGNTYFTLLNLSLTFQTDLIEACWKLESFRGEGMMGMSR